MKHLSVCRFCDIVDGKYQYDGIDQPFSSNDDYIAIASIGALIEGWSLIVPKEHQLSMRHIYNKAGFADFVESIIPLLVGRYGPLIAFEHGSNKEGSLTACGTDHAHLHLVPFTDSLLPELQGSNLRWVQCRASEIPDRVGNQEYLFYGELGSAKVWRDPLGYLHVLERPISQFFRHLIASQLNCVDISDYRRFPHLETARQTHKMLVR